MPEESGFTLLELLVSMIVLAFIGTGVAACVLLFFKTADATTTRLSLSHDSQILANYLIPDLDSLTPGQPAVTPSTVQTCPAGFTGFQDLQVRFTDISTAVTYLSDYAVTGSSITRTFGPVGQATTTLTVVHNLKPGNACFSTVPSVAPWTMQVTVEVNADPTTDYTFSVTGGGRVTASPVPGAPTFVSAVSQDTNHDGKVNQVTVTFDQPLNTNDTSGTTQWTLSRQPPGVSLNSVSVSGTTATLSLNEGSTVDTLAAGFTVALTAAAEGIRDGINQPASFGPEPVTDGMGPVPTSAVLADAPSNTVEVVVTFSEALGTYGAGTTPWTVSGLPTGASLASVSVSASAATLSFTENPVDTSATSLQVALAFIPLGVTDLDGNISSFPSMAVADHAAPVPVSLVSQDTNGRGTVDQVVVTFSEQLDAYAAGIGPWSLSGQPPGVILDSVSVSGNTATLTVGGGAGIDTVAAGFQVALAADPDGIRDLAGNQSSFDPSTVTDGMGPVVESISDGVTGQMATGESLTLNFSEPLLPSTLPANPTVTLTPGSGGDDVLTIDGVATIDLGGHFNTSTATFASRLTSALLPGSVEAVTIALGAESGGSTAATPTAKIVVTPAAAVTDIAANPADGSLTTGPIELF